MDRSIGSAAVELRLAARFSSHARSCAAFLFFCRRAGMAELAFPAMTACERLLHGDGAP